MEIITNYNNTTRTMIDGASYNLPPDLSENTNYKIKLSLLSAAGTFLNDYILEENKEYYIKDGNLFLRPNELLDRENYTEGNYTLQFDFITRYEDQPFYITEISPTRKEVRLATQNIKNVKYLRDFYDLQKTFKRIRPEQGNPNSSLEFVPI